MSKLGFGIIGPGNIAKKFADAISQNEESYLAAVSSKSLTRAKEFAKKYSASSYYDSYDEMCKDVNVDVVYISTTSNYHYQNILTCINNKKPVICEKPLVLFADQARDVFAKAKENNVFVMEAMWSRFLPSSQKVRQLINSGEIGDIKHIDSSFNMRLEYDPKHCIFNKALGGGVLYDLGVYNISLSCFYTDEKPSKYYGFKEICDEGTDIKDTVIMEFPSKATASFVCGTLIDGQNDMTIEGTRGSIKLLFPFYDSREVQIIRDGQVEETISFDYTNGFTYELAEVIDCIKKGKLQSEIISWQDTLDCIEITENLLKEK